MVRNFPSTAKKNVALGLLLLGGSLMSGLHAQTCPPTVTYSPAGTWGAATPNPAPFGPYNRCTNTDGKTTYTNFTNDHGFYSEYDGTPTWNWSRTLTGLDPNKTYQVYIHMETENTYHRRHLIFDYNLAGKTGTYTTAGDAGGSSIGLLQTFNISGKSTLNFTGSLHADAYMGCEQAQELRFNLAVQEVITTPMPAPQVSTSIVKNNVCPSQMLDLSGIVTSSCAAGSTLEWHTSATATAANKVANPAGVAQGTYYAFCRKAAGNCYSPASMAVNATAKACNLVDDNVTAVLPIDQNIGEGDITLNDMIEPGSTIGTPIRTDFGPRFGVQLMFMPDGTYFYIINSPTPWTYQFTIPVCPPGETDESTCPTEVLSITVPAERRALTGTTQATNEISPVTAFVYPNPVVNGTCTLVYQNIEGKNEILHIQLTDMSGRVVYTTNENITSGVNKIQVQTDNLSKGVYYLKYNNDGMKVNGTTKVVVK